MTMMFVSDSTTPVSACQVDIDFDVSFISAMMLVLCETGVIIHCFISDILE